MTQPPEPGPPPGHVAPDPVPPGAYGPPAYGPPGAYGPPPPAYGPSPPPPAPTRRNVPEPQTAMAARVLFGVLGAVLLVFGVFCLFTAGSTAEEYYAEFVAEDPSLATELNETVVYAITVMSAFLQIAMGFGFGLTMFGILRETRWARPVGYSVAGVLLAISVLALVELNPIQIAFGIAAVVGIVMLSAREVRDYLNPKTPQYVAYPPYPPAPIS